MAKTKIPGNPDLGKNLKLLMRQTAGLQSQHELSQKTGLSQSTVGRILRGEVNPSAAALSRIAGLFSVEMGDLYLPHEAFIQRHERANVRTMRELTSGIDDFTRRLREGRVALLDWNFADEEPTVRDWVVCPVEHSTSAYALEVQGLSMLDPTGAISFREGERIFLDKRAPKDGVFVAVRVGGNERAILRQLVAEGGAWHLVALNPNWPNRITHLADEDQLVGVVIAKLQILLTEDPKQPE